MEYKTIVAELSDAENIRKIILNNIRKEMWRSWIIDADNENKKYEVILFTSPLKARIFIDPKMISFKEIAYLLKKLEKENFDTEIWTENEEIIVNYKSSQNKTEIFLKDEDLYFYQEIIGNLSLKMLEFVKIKKDNVSISLNDDYFIMEIKNNKISMKIKSFAVIDYNLTENDFVLFENEEKENFENLVKLVNDKELLEIIEKAK